MNLRIFRTTLLAASALLASLDADAQITVKVESFPVSDVRLTGGPFKHAEDMDIRYLLALDPDRLLAPYMKEAGLTPKADNYTNWENTGLDGHIGGHYLSALSFMYAATGNSEIKTRLDYMLAELKRCQDAAGDGYLCGVPDGRRIWCEISEGKIKASAFGLNGGWVPLYNIHKIYAGLRDAWQQAGSREARTMLIRLTDWMADVVAGLDDAQVQKMLDSEHGGLNETFADVAAITGDKKYLELARRFSHRRLLDPLLNHEDRLTGMHANTQIPKVIGFKRIADIDGDKSWDDAARFFWLTVMENRTITIGGNSVREHFHPADNFTSMLTSEQGPETCNTYNMLRLAKMLYATSCDPMYIDYYEQALYNHILSTQNPVQGGFVYFTPMRPGHYRVYSQPQTSFWCCVGSGMENHARYGEMIYGHYGDEELYVNLFIPSTLQWGNVNIEQQTAFPDEEATTIVINPKKKSGAEFLLHIRCPHWIEDVDDARLTVNGEPQDVLVHEGYYSIKRKWKPGDRVRMEMSPHLSAVKLPDGSPNYSFLYGPVVLAAQTGKQQQDGLFADDSRGGHIAAGPKLPLQNMPVIVDDSGDVLTHINKVDGRLAFNLDCVTPEGHTTMTLVPFSRLHECRYMVYWPVISSQEMQARKDSLEREEQARAALDAITADKVTCGEQQPESDHFVKSEKSVTGDDNDMHWRDASGWFSYVLRTGGNAVGKVRIVFRDDSRRDMRVWADDDELTDFADTRQSSGLTVREYNLPQSSAGREQIVLKIGRGDKSATPRIYEVRLMKAE